MTFEKIIPISFSLLICGLIVCLGIKVIYDVHKEYFKIKKDSNHIELNGIISDFKTIGSGYRSRKCAVVEFKYKEETIKRVDRRHLVNNNKIGEKVNIFILPDDKDLNIVIIDDESSIGAFEFFLGIVYIIIGILLFLYIINSFY